MNNELNYKNNPLNGVSSKNMLTELVSHYGFDILFAYLNINSFKNNPTIESSAKFLKRTEWAREKVELFYLYKFKNLPRVSSEQFQTPPRDRIVPDDQVPRDPKNLTVEEGIASREKSASQRPRSGNSFAASRNKKYPKSRENKTSYSKDTSDDNNDNADSSSRNPLADGADPWAKWRE